MRILMELPFYSTTSGGVRESLKLAEKMNMAVRFQRLTEEYPQIPMAWSVGLPDNTFPECDVCITYSDTPYLDRLISLPQVGKVYLNMLSYGMAIEREHKNIMNPNVTVLCSTKKLEKVISMQGVTVTRIGFALDMEEMKCDDLVRYRAIAILYNEMESKRSQMAIGVGERLVKEGYIDGIMIIQNADRQGIREIFNSCKCFLMPSVSEGLNLTPIEATLCGCPSVICDGAIGEIFFNEQNCFVTPKDNTSLMIGKVKEVIDNYDKYAEPFRANMAEIVKEHTWDKLITNLTAVL
jgi:glycosyltransferase involved in cell wall biosynthesis